MEDYTITRTGDRPLSFIGELVAEASSETDNPRWHELAIYRTKGGTIVAHCAYRTRWDGELDYHKTWSINPSVVPPGADIMGAIAGHLREYDPCQAVLAFRGMPGRSEKQERVEQDLRHRYEEAVSRLFADTPQDLA